MQNLPSPIFIIGMTGQSGVIALGIIRLLYRTLDSSVNLIINNILYLLEASANLISAFKLQRAGCPLIFIDKGIFISQNRVLAKLYNNNLYYIKISAEAKALHTQKTTTAAIIYNQDTINYWYQLIGYLGKQNIRKLPQIINNINLNYLLTNNNYYYVIYAKIQIKNLPYKGYIKLNQYENKLIYINIFGLIEDTLSYT